MSIEVITNHVPRDVVEAWELTPAERLEFDYLPWEDIDNGNASASFVRYMGETYDLGEFTGTAGLPGDWLLDRWDGYLSDSFFSGVVVRYVEQCERVIVGRWLA